MAKKLGKKNKKKGLDTRDFAVIGGYLIFFLIIGFLYAQASSGNKEVKKLETRQEMLEGANMLKKAGVPFSAYFMAGFPGETDDDLKQTIDFAKKVDADYYSLSV